MKLIPFFALRDDILPILESVESEVALKYVPMGCFFKDDLKGWIIELTSGTQIPNLGRASCKTAGGCDAFLVCARDEAIHLRDVVQAARPRVCIDQLVNPHTVEFTPAGLVDEATPIILSGRIATASGAPVSQALMKQFHVAINKSFTKVRAFYVGSAALKLWENGARLTDAVQSPREYDLALPKDG